MNSSRRIAFAYITTPHRDEARALGRRLVEKKLAGCANIFEAMESIYPWEGKVEQSPEVLLIAKTEPRLREALTEEVMQQHSYDTPCVLFFEADAGDTGFFEWLRGNLEPDRTETPSSSLSGQSTMLPLMPGEPGEVNA